MRWHRHLITEIPKMVFNVKKKKKNKTKELLLNITVKKTALTTLREGTTPGKSVQLCRHLLFLGAALCDCHSVGWFS